MSTVETTGCELELFAEAWRWKRYFASELKPFVAGRVLEVGAGIGETTFALMNPAVTEWTSLEPSTELFGRLTSRYGAEHSAVRPMAIEGTLADVSDAERFDTIVYIDVLEHIEDDAGEVHAAARRLHDGGRLVVLCPAHNFLMSDFDRAIGHHRRYDRAMMRALTPPGLAVQRMFYLDTAGMVLSLANRVFLRQSLPSPSQISLWNKWVVPVSMVLDRLTFHRFGKTICVVWRKAEER